MRDAQGDGGHPAEGFLDAGADVGQVWFVSHGGEAVRADDAVNFLLGALLHVGEDEHGLDEADEGVGCRFGAGFEEVAADVPG